MKYKYVDPLFLYMKLKYNITFKILCFKCNYKT